MLLRSCYMTSLGLRRIFAGYIPTGFAVGKKFKCRCKQPLCTSVLIVPTSETARLYILQSPDTVHFEVRVGEFEAAEQLVSQQYRGAKQRNVDRHACLSVCLPVCLSDCLCVYLCVHTYVCMYV